MVNGFVLIPGGVIWFGLKLLKFTDLKVMVMVVFDGDFVDCWYRNVKKW